MADAITWVIDADGSRVTAEMQKMLQTARSTAGGIVDANKKVETMNANLLQSNKSVARAFNYAAQDMLRGAGALDVFSNSATFLAAALRLPLVPLLALVTAALGANKVREIKAEFAGLNKEAAELEKKDLIKLKTEELEKAKADAERISKGLKEQLTGVKGFINKFGDRRTSFQLAIGEQPGMERSPFGAGRIQGATDPWEASRGRREEFAREQAAAYHKKRLDDIPKEVDIEIARRNKEALLQTEAASFKGKLQLSLAEIAKEGHRPAGFDNTKTPAADLARRAIREEEMARKAILREDYPAATHHQARAEQLKANIPGLKDSEKIAGLLTKGNEHLREIVQKVTFKRGGGQ